MIAAIRALLASRKFVLLLVGVIVAIGGRLGLQLDAEVIGMILGLVAVGMGSIAYEDGQAKRATVIDGAAMDGPWSPSSTPRVEWRGATKADVVAAMVDPDPVVRVPEGTP